MTVFVDESSYQDRIKLGATFDSICKTLHPTGREFVIPPHQEKASAFDWFIKGVAYERGRRKESLEPPPEKDI